VSNATAYIWYSIGRLASSGSRPNGLSLFAVTTQLHPGSRNHPKNQGGPSSGFNVYARITAEYWLQPPINSDFRGGSACGLERHVIVDCRDNLDHGHNNCFHDSLEQTEIFALKAPRKCRETRCEMNGKKRGIEGNNEESSDVDFFRNFSRFAANSKQFDAVQILS